MENSKVYLPVFSKDFCLTVKILQTVWSLLLGLWIEVEGISYIILKHGAVKNLAAQIAGLILFGVVMVGVIISWPRPRTGGLITVILTVLFWFSLFLVEGWRWTTPFYFTLPIFVFGIMLFLFCGRRG